MLQELIDQERKSLNYFLDNLDLKKVEELIQAIQQSEGKIILTGMGKSGIIAKKIAVTMTSIGTRAFYLSPANALHGDIGLVGEDDIFLFLSKSGETEELLNLIPYVRNKGAKTIALVCEENSRLEDACDSSLHLPLDEELCPLNLVPTTSMVLMLIFGDILAVELMIRKKFTIEDYALNHPAGRIGRRITLKVDDLMLQGDKLPLTSPNNLLVDTLGELSDKQCGCVLVIDDKERLMGIFTDGDLRRILQVKGAEALQLPMQEIMNSKPKWISAEKLAWEAMQLMEKDQKHPITALPVLNEEKQVIGLVKMHDLVQTGV